MYNKIFTKILDSSIWLAPDPHRLVWITLIAAMGPDGIAEFACPENLAARARVSLVETQLAILAFESPDPHDPTQEHDGRRIERVAGGWLILNAEKYRSMVTRAIATEKSRERMRQFRERQRVARDDVTERNEPSPETPLRFVTPSGSGSGSGSAAKNKKAKTPRPATEPPFDSTSVLHLDPIAWNQWVTYREMRKPALKQVSLPSAAKLLASFGDQQAAVVERAIANGWQGLHGLDGSASRRDRMRLAAAGAEDCDEDF